MKLQSIRVKSSLPIVLLGIAIVVLIAGYTYLINLQKAALETQSVRFLNAISVVLNADRDLYQAKVAELNLVTNKKGDAGELQNHSENAQQVADRFKQYLSYLSVYPEVTASVNNFDSAFSRWLSASEAYINASQNKSNEQAANREFDALRDILDKAGERAESVSKVEKQKLIDKINNTKWLLLFMILIILAIAGWFSYQMS